jgi:hypothetical protein
MLKAIKFLPRCYLSEVDDVDFRKPEVENSMKENFSEEDLALVLSWAVNTKLYRTWVSGCRWGR